MMDFIYELYQNDNFTLYLTIALIVLIIIFIIVFFFGKKDQKLEETKRLEKIELDTFKKEEKLPSVVEVKEEKEEMVEQRPVNDVNVIEFKPEIVEEETEIELPSLVNAPRKPLFSDHEEEQSPISLNELPVLESDNDDELENGLNILENIKNEFNDIELPNEKESSNVDTYEETKIEEKPIFKPSPVFSSVFVNKEDNIINNQEKPLFEEKNNDLNNSNETLITKDEKENNNNEPVINEDNISSVSEEKKETISFGKTFIIEDEEDFELPSLKSEDVVHSNEEKTFSFEDVNGENYNLK